MAKKFMFVCIGILALTVAFLLGAQFGRAGYVDHSASGIIATGFYGSEESPRVLTSNGEVWIWNGQLRVWAQMGTTLPVPVSEVGFWETGRYTAYIVTKSGEVWVGGQNVGSPPGGVATEPSTWGGIKAQFNK
jgi:hypothetical protein